MEQAESNADEAVSADGTGTVTTDTGPCCHSSPRALEGPTAGRPDRASSCVATVQHYADEEASGARYSADSAVPSWSVAERFLTRIAGLGESWIRDLEIPELISSLSELRNAEETLKLQAGQVAVALGELVPHTPDTKRRRLLLATRRSVYNRELKPAAAAELSQRFQGRAAELMREYKLIAAKRDGCRERVEQLCEAGIQAGHRTVRRALETDDFARAVQLSSDSLANALNSWRPGVLTPRGKQARVERALLRYLIRAAAKATPFARFCTLALGELRQTTSSRTLVFESATSSITQSAAVVTANKAILALCWGALRADDETRGKLTVATNPTASLTDNVLSFLSVVGGEEVLRKLRVSSRLVELWAALTAISPCRVDRLVECLSVVDASFDDREEVDQFLGQLISIGLLELNPLVDEMEREWPRLLSHALSAVDSGLALAIRPEIEELVDIIERLPALSATARAPLLSSARKTIGRLEAICGRKVSVAEAPILFEDAATESTVTLVRNREVDESIAELTEYLEVTQHIAWPVAQQRQLSAFFRSAFANTARPVPLPIFYEEWALNRRTAAQRRRAAGSDRSGELQRAGESDAERVEARRDIGAEITEAIRLRWAGDLECEEIQVSLADLREIVGSVSDGVTTASSSVAMFLNVVSLEGEQGVSVVVKDGRYYGGYGKYWSRFLPVLPTLLEELEYSSADPRRPLLCEIVGDESFNANLHPPVLPAYLIYPGKRVGRDVEAVHWTGLDVVPSRDGGERLELIRRSDGRRVVPVDLGFLNLQMRPPLYQLLVEFTTAPAFGLRLPQSAGSTTNEGSERPLPRVVTRRPRIRLGRHIVVSRQRWSLSISELPRCLPGESIGGFCARVESWRRECGLPEEAYFSVLSLEQPDKGRAHVPPDAQQEDDVKKGGPPRVSLDWRKPHYVSFASPILVQVLGHLPEFAPGSILSFEECLPGRAAWLRDRSGDRYASELVVQWQRSPHRD